VVDPSATYREIGLRSFGRGVFHKEPVTGRDLGDKQVFSIEPGDLVLSIVFAWEGAVAIVGETERGFIASHRFPTFRVDETAVDLSYIRWFLLSGRGLHLLNEHSPGAAGRNRTLDRQALLSERIKLPTLADQRDIARRLDAFATVYSCQQHLHNLSAERLRIMSADAVFGWNTSVAMKPTGLQAIRKIPRHWEWVRNKTLLREVTERAGDDPCELLTVSHLTGITPRSEKTEVHMFLAESFEDYKRVRPGDVAVNTMWAWMGAVGVATCDGIVSPSYNVYRFRSGAPVVPRYFDYLFRTPQYVVEMNRHSKGIWESRLRLYPEQFLSLRSPVPPVSEQEHVVELLDRQRARINGVATALQELDNNSGEYRQALLAGSQEAA
jgi:type I restriction enzyme S subunit